MRMGRSLSNRENINTKKKVAKALWILSFTPCYLQTILRIRRNLSLRGTWKKVSIEILVIFQYWSFIYVVFMVLFSHQFVINCQTKWYYTTIHMQFSSFPFMSCGVRIWMTVTHPALSGRGNAASLVSSAPRATPAMFNSSNDEVLCTPTVNG